jgi:division protein CdvB (Snf7/Vps24/ESCRT-III family)
LKTRFSQYRVFFKVEWTGRDLNPRLPPCEGGDVVTVLAPAAGVLNNIRSGMSGIFPEAGHELGNIGTLLTDIVSTTNQNTGMSVNVGNASLEAEKILEEAETAAERKLKAQLPEVSTAASPQEKTSVET